MPRFESLPQDVHRKFQNSLFDLNGSYQRLFYIRLERKINLTLEDEFGIFFFDRFFFSHLILKSLDEKRGLLFAENS